MSKVISFKNLVFHTGIGIIRMNRIVYYSYVEYDVYDSSCLILKRFRLYKNGLGLSRLDDIMLHIVLNRFYLNK